MNSLPDEYLVLTGANMPTLPDRRADTLVVHRGKIRTIGRWHELKHDLPSGTIHKDVAGGTLLPGLMDAHVHFTATGFLMTALDCSLMTSLADLLRSIYETARSKPPGALILGLRLSTQDWPEGRNPSRSELDAVAPDHPVYLRNITGHSSLANSRALELLDFPVGQPGVTLGDDGAPEGYLIAQATQLATQRMYARYAQEVGYETAFHAAAQRAAQSGCTTVHALDDLGAVRELLTLKSTLPTRVLPYTQTFDLQAVRELGLPRIGGCHGCALDGDFDMHTAALFEPYEGMANACGVLYNDDDALNAFVLEAHQAGVQTAFHAVGDRAVEQALQAFERAQAQHPRPNARHRIEHAQLITNEQIRRAQVAGVIISVQPAFNHFWPHETYPQFIGKRSSHVDPLASLQTAGIPLAGGSDSTVTPLRPLLGIHAAVNHSRPEERLSVRDALTLFTQGVAFSTFDEHRRGSLQEGLDADVIILEEDLFTLEPERIKEVNVQMTLTRGTIVHEAS